ncbi:hypothetical protein HY572_01700 [Candidatus Micrarchaeota archaeon]|nr:hypothetical protein [Candidatus Micrarchaeota archaeon]
MRRGFALFWVFGVIAAATGWSASLVSFSSELDDYSLAMMQLSQRRVVGHDVRNFLHDALSGARGGSLEEVALDAGRRAVAGERFLEAAYLQRGVDLDVVFGLVSDVEVSAWLDLMRSDQAIRPCPRCLDVGVAEGLLFLESLDDSLNVSWGPNFPFPVFGTPFFGAVFSFGDVVGVEAV